MKKIVCTLLALIMLCSLVVVNVSATEDTGTYWETAYFVLDSNVELVDNGLFEEEGSIGYFYSLPAQDNEWIGEIDIAIYYADNSSEVFEDNLSYFEEDFDVEEVVIDGRVGYQFYDNTDELMSRYTIVYVDDMYYSIGAEGLVDYEEEFETLCNIIDSGLSFNSLSEEDIESEVDIEDDKDDEDDTDDKEDKDDKDVKDNKDDKTTDEDEESESDDSTVIIIVAVVAGVVVLGVVAIVVLGKKKKQ